MNEEIKEDIFECKMYITDLETEQKSKEIDVEKVIVYIKKISLEVIKNVIMYN